MKIYLSSLDLNSIWIYYWYNYRRSGYLQFYSLLQAVIFTVLPPVIAEEKAFPFKFWFHNNIKDGIYYRNELFYRLHTVDRSQRSRLYHYACKLTRYSQVLVTASEQKCSLWISLRSPNLIVSDAIAQPLPSLAELTRDEHPELE